MSFSSWFRLAALIGLTLAARAIADGPRPVLMGVMGDSISAGTFANHDAVTQNRMESVHLPSGSIVPFLGKWENKDTYSWASGLDLPSHFVRLRDYLAPKGEALTVLNVSVPGSLTKDLLSQADALVQAMQGGNYTALKYVTLMIGANDACSTATPTGTPEDQMEQEIESALKRLTDISQNEPIRVLVSAVPKIPDLARPEILDTPTVGGMSCQQLRDQTVHECDPMTQWSTPEEHDAKMAVIDAKNQAIQNVVKKAQAQLPQLSVVYSDEFYRATILPSYLARDCFHPGTRGHGELSQRLWRAQPWFK